jgi:uncharacterized protein YcsI (UPF0317 family)
MLTSIYDFSMPKVEAATLREEIRAGKFRGPTAGLAPGMAQANLVILPAVDAAGFERFCTLNPRPCPLLEVTQPGDPVPHLMAPTADLRHDVPLYNVYRGGALVEQLPDIAALWQDDFVAFLLGCSFTFDHALLRAGIPVRHVQMGRNVPMYVTGRPCTPAGRFEGPLVVSMRPIPEALVPEATRLTAQYPTMHGAPVHAGDPHALGIADLAAPDYGDPVPILEGEVPVFWACGVTPQAVAVHSRVPLMITHAPGCMFITERTDEEIIGD